MRHPAPKTGDRGRRAASGFSRGFALRFLASSLVLFALYWSVEALHAFRQVNVAHARATAGVLRAIGIGAEAHATSILLARGSLEIVAECTGVYVLILFTAGILAFPTAWRTRLHGLAMGLPCIVALNFIRLVSLGVILHFRPAWLAWFHEYLWQVLFVGLVAVLFGVWVARTGDDRARLAAS